MLGKSKTGKKWKIQSSNIKVVVVVVVIVVVVVVVVEGTLLG